MELKDLLGESYKEGMTIEEINAVLKDKTFVDPSTLPRSVDKSVFDKTASELAAAKKKLRELEESTMTAEEKLNAEMAKAAEAQSTYAKELSKLRAKEVFVGAGLKEEDYADLLDLVVSEDEEITKTRASNMVKLVNAQKQAAEEALKAELLKNTPKPPAGTGGQVGTASSKAVEEAMSRGDMATAAAIMRQQQMSNKGDG